MKITVIGAGAIGGLVAAYLAREHNDITLIARPNQVEAIAKEELKIEGARGALSVSISVKGKMDAPADWVILATKTQDLETALNDNKDYLAAASILTTQNGVRAEKIVRERFPSARVFASIVMFGVTYLNPGKITHNFEGPWVMGPLDGKNAGSLEEFKSAVGNAFSCIVTDSILPMKWLKLFVNANNCLPAILGKSMQETFKNQQICQISMEIWREGLDLVEKAGITLLDLPDFPKERISRLLSLPVDQAAGIFSGIMTGLSQEPLYGSILQSIKRDRASEIDYINGEFVALSERMKTAAPLNAKLVELVHKVETEKQFLSEEELLNNVRKQ